MDTLDLVGEDPLFLLEGIDVLTLITFILIFYDKKYNENPTYVKNNER